MLGRQTLLLILGRHGRYVLLYRSPVQVTSKSSMGDPLGLRTLILEISLIFRILGLV